jgi:hypothetical protein
MIGPQLLKLLLLFLSKLSLRCNGYRKKGRPADRKSTHIWEGRFGVQVTRKVLPNFLAS